MTPPVLAAAVDTSRADLSPPASMPDESPTLPLSKEWLVGLIKEPQARALADFAAAQCPYRDGGASEAAAEADSTQDSGAEKSLVIHVDKEKAGDRLNRVHIHLVISVRAGVALLCLDTRPHLVVCCRAHHSVSVSMAGIR